MGRVKGFHVGDLVRSKLVEPSLGMHYPLSPGTVGRVVDVDYLEDIEILRVVWPEGTVLPSNSGWWCMACYVELFSREWSQEDSELDDFLQEFEVV